MTHDELLAKIDELETSYTGLCNYFEWPCSDLHKLVRALRATAELHRPTPDPMVPKNMICWGCWTEFGLEWPEYPCDTIQAIEKELK